jgi:hypothetical protein
VVPVREAEDIRSVALAADVEGEKAGEREFVLARAWWRLHNETGTIRIASALKFGKD